MAILAGEDPHLSASALASHRARLRSHGLLETRRRGMLHLHDSPLRAVAAGLLESRPRLAKELAGPLHLDVLSAQHALQERRLRSTRSRLQWLSGSSPTAFRRVLEELRDANLILEAPDPTLNPDLSPLHAFLAALQGQAALPRGLEDAVTIHSAGLEAAWATKSPSRGYANVADHGPLRVLLQPRSIQFRGPRRLDRWDHAFLYLLQDARRSPSITPSARSKALVMATMTSKLTTSKAFGFRAAFYGLESFLDDATKVLCQEGHPFQEFVDQHRSRGVPEGWLDARQG